MKVKYSEHCVISKENDGTEITLQDYQRELKFMLKDVKKALDEMKVPYFIEGGTLLGAVRHQDIIPWDDDIDICFFINDYDKLLKGLHKNLDSSLYVVQCFDTDKNYNVTQPIIKVRKKNTYVHTYDAVYERNNCKEKGIFIDFIEITRVPKSVFLNRIYRYQALVRTLFLLGFNKLNINLTWLKKRHLKKAKAFHEKGKDSNLYGYGLNMVAWQNFCIEERVLFPFQSYTFGDITMPGPADADAYLRQTYGDYMEIPNLDEVELYHSKDVKLKSNK